MRLSPNAKLSIVGSNMTGNSATYYGGCLHLNGGTAIISGSHLRNNTALFGQNIYSEGGSSTYQLPAPVGYWVPGQMCKVYRRSCAPHDSACRNAFEECSTILPTVSATTAGGQTCEDTTFSQPCDWSSLPDIVGSLVYPLPSGAFDTDVPLPCAAGLLGGSDASTQKDSLCAGPCEAGTLCSSKPTLVPLACIPGHYCPEGSSVALPCPAGRFRNASGGTDAEACDLSPPGSHSTAGSTSPKPCPLAASLRFTAPPTAPRALRGPTCRSPTRPNATRASRGPSAPRVRRRRCPAPVAPTRWQPIFLSNPSAACVSLARGAQTAGSYLAPKVCSATRHQLAHTSRHRPRPREVPPRASTHQTHDRARLQVFTTRWRVNRRWKPVKDAR